MCDEEHAQGIDKAVFPGIQGGPLEHIIAGKDLIKEVDRRHNTEKKQEIIVNMTNLNIRLTCAQHHQRIQHQQSVIKIAIEV